MQLLCSDLLEAPPLAKLRRLFEGFIDRAAVDARVIQLAMDKLAPRQQGGLPFAIGDGRDNPAVEKSPQTRDWEALPRGRQARFVQRAGAQANDVGRVALRQQAFW